MSATDKHEKTCRYGHGPLKIIKPLPTLSIGPRGSEYFDGHGWAMLGMTHYSSTVESSVETPLEEVRKNGVQVILSVYECEVCGYAELSTRWLNI